MQTLLQNPIVLSALSSLITWVVQALLTPQVSKLAPDSKAKRLIRKAHGLLDIVDPD